MVQQNLEPALPESKEPKSSEEVLFIGAIQSAKINKRPIEELREVLRLVLVKVGVRAANWPDDTEKTVLLEHIVTHYGNHTAEEIKLAFDLAILGKLSVDANCYENFSCKYFSDIMNAYRIWASKTYNQVVKETPKEDKKEDLSDVAMIQWWNEVVRRINVEGLKMDFVPPALYEWKDRNGGINKTAKEKREYINRAVSYRNGFLLTQWQKSGFEDDKNLLDRFTRMMEQGYLEGDEIKRVTDISKRMILYDMMKNK